jgi:GMP synthase (glutamine-hydrolysing)
MQHKGILILDFGSQFTQLIARRIREMNVYCEIHPCTEPFHEDWFYDGIVLSGGPASVLGEDAPDVDVRWLQETTSTLGVCYGMQMMAQQTGCQLQRGQKREYGQSTLCLTKTHAFVDGVPAASIAWMSHGDHVETVGDEWDILGRSDSGVIATIAHRKHPWVAVQFHPEVAHTEFGERLLQNFVLNMCNAPQNWTMGNFVSEQIASLQQQIGSGHVICGLSGGVDSSVTAAILQRAIGEQLHCVFVDNGLLRQGERESVEAEFSEFELTVVDASSEFLSALEGVTDPEQKRKIIGRVFIEVFDKEAARLADIHGDIEWLAQGTLYPDVIESLSFRGPSATIKSHHNVGGLPEDMRFQLIEPLRELFKDEVRALGIELGLSHHRVFRHPFPGPGLAVRMLGPITAERLELLRRADHIFIEEIRGFGWYDKIWQAGVVFLPVKSVGVMGDDRTYEWTVALRAVHSRDGMTADVVRLPWELLERVSTRIINEIRGINRVAYDVSNKPPVTIEWE